MIIAASGMDPQNPLIALSVMVGLALVAAYITFRALSSTGAAKTQLGELGGAAAGFVVILGVLAGIYYGLEPRWGKTEDLKKQVAEQKQVIASASVPADFQIPASFTPVLDRPHGLAFGYPTRWLKAYALQTYQQNPLSLPDRQRAASLVVVVEDLKKKTYSVREVYAASRLDGISPKKVKAEIGVPLTRKTAVLQVPLAKLLTILGAHGKSVREKIYDASYQLVRGTLPGSFSRGDDRLIDGIPSLVVEHRAGRDPDSLLQFIVETYVARQDSLVSITFTDTAGDRKGLSGIRERVLGTVKFWPSPSSEASP